MTPREAFMFGRLAEAIEGKTIESVILRDDSGVYLSDYSGVFGAIIAFTSAKFRINDIRQLADDFERALFREEP